MNIQKIMQQANEMQKKLKKELDEFEKKEFVHDYKSLLKVTLLGNLTIVSIEINEEVKEDFDIDMTTDSIQAAINEAIAKVQQEKEKATSSVAPAGLGNLF